MAAFVARAVVLAVLSGASAACILVTGGTDGYEREPSDGGSDGGASSSIAFECASSAECAGDGGVCCLVVTSRTSASARCQAGPCDEAAGAQLCRTTTECAGKPCVAQRCALSGVNVALQACGALATCTPQ